jgi:hypothetical protein
MMVRGDGAPASDGEMKRAGSPNLPALFVIAATHVAMHCHDTGSAWVRDR